jgi:pectate lyase
MTGKDALEIFNENDVFDYIKKFYDILHTTGDGYIVKDIDRYIESRVN